jgi:hypothetical protein
MTLQQTATIPADRRLHLELPKAAKPRLLTQAEFDAGLPCPMDHSKPNAVTIAAMQEVQDIIDGKIPAAMTIDVSWCKTTEDIEAAIQSAFDAADEEEDEDED